MNYSKIIQTVRNTESFRFFTNETLKSALEDVLIKSTSALEVPAHLDAHENISNRIKLKSIKTHPYAGNDI